MNSKWTSISAAEGKFNFDKSKWLNYFKGKTHIFVDKELKLACPRPFSAPFFLDQCRFGSRWSQVSWALEKAHLVGGGFSAVVFCLINLGSARWFSLRLSDHFQAGLATTSVLWGAADPLTSSCLPQQPLGLWSLPKCLLWGPWALGYGGSLVSHLLWILSYLLWPFPGWHENLTNVLHTL